MNPKLIFLIEFCKLVGRLGTAASNNDTASFLRLLELVRKLCDTIERNLIFRVIDIEEDIDDDEL